MEGENCNYARVLKYRVALVKAQHRYVFTIAETIFGAAWKFMAPQEQYLQTLETP